MPKLLQVYSVPAFRGGVNDSAAFFGGMQEDESLVARNLFLDGNGRLALRRGAEVRSTLLDATATEIDQVLWVGLFGSLVMAVGYSASDEKTWLYKSTDQDGTDLAVVPAAYATPLWTGATIPRVVAQEIQAPEGNRLWFADAGGTYPLTYTNGSTITAPTVSLDGAAADYLYPTFVHEFNYHLFIGGYDSDSNASAPEYLRWSQPGLIAGVDPVDAVSKEWWTNDFEPVGRAGEPIKTMGKVGGGLVLVKENSVHAWWGVNTDTWGQRQINTQFGAVNEASAVADGWLYYMSTQGPCRTNGEVVQFIGDGIRTSVAGYAHPEFTVIFHLPEKFQVMYGFVAGGDTYASRFKAWSYRHEAWTEPEYWEAAGARLFVRSGGVITTSTLPGPSTAPSSLAAVAAMDDATCTATTDLTWTNGDTAPGTETLIFRINQLVAPVDADWTTLRTNGTIHATVPAGVASYEDSVTQDQPYWYQIIHRRNGQYSNWNGNTANPATTDVFERSEAAPSAPSAPSGLSALNQSSCPGGIP